LSKDQKLTAINKIPSLLEVAGYTFFPASYMVGPQFPLSRYLQMVNGTLKPEVILVTIKIRRHLQINIFQGQEKPECVTPGLLRGLLGFTYLGIYQVGNIYFKDDYLISAQFMVIIKIDLV